MKYVSVQEALSVWHWSPEVLCGPRPSVPNGTGSITVNGRSIDEYFGLDTLKMLVRQPLEATGNTGKMDVVATVTGGGVSGQAGACGTVSPAPCCWPARTTVPS